MRSFQSLRVISTFSSPPTLHFAERQKQCFWLGIGSPLCRLVEGGAGEVPGLVPVPQLPVELAVGVLTGRTRWGMRSVCPGWPG